MSKQFGIKNYKQLTAELEQMKKAPRTVLDRTLSDVKKRAPGWISAEVAQEYGIKKKEVGDGKTSKLKIEGKKMPDVKLVYSGRVLTPTHFGMTPKVPKAGGGAYTLKASIIKGQKATLGKVKKLSKKQRAALGKNFRREGTRTSDHSPIMLMRTGNAKEGGTDYIPFQRKSTKRKDVEAIKTVSVPQMIENRAAEGIRETLNENVGKRLDHHMKRLMK